jgi:hypothetical protein
MVETTEPGRLVVTTSDDSTGGVSVVDVGDRKVQTDVALSENDSRPFFAGDQVYVIHRLGFDRIDILDPNDGFRLIGQHPVSEEAGSRSPNPQAIALASDGGAFVSNFGSPFLHVYDLEQPPGESLVKRIDLSGFADADGRPEQSLLVSCGSTLFVAARRLDNDFQRTGPEILIPIDAASCQPYEQTLTNLGWFARAVRQDPSDHQGHTVVMLTTGLERVNLATGDVSWLVSDETLASVGIEGFQAQSFDFHGKDTVYLAAYRADYSAVDVWRISLADGPSKAEAPPQVVITGLNATEKTLEIIADELWFGDTTTGGEGLRVYDLTVSPPRLVAGPLSTGLPPASMLAIP